MTSNGAIWEAHMIGYTLVGSNDLEKAKAFYDALFDTVGVKRLMEFPTGGCAWGAARR